MKHLKVSCAETCVSLVSTGRFQEVMELLKQFQTLGIEFENIILTINTPETIEVDDLDLENVNVFCNLERRGFGDNHNYAHSLSSSRHFLVMNADLELNSDFYRLFEDLYTEPCIVSPLVGGAAVLSQRRAVGWELPLMGTFVRKVLPEIRIRSYQSAKISPIEQGWFSGCCMYFGNGSFNLLNGFDERFFIYYEDVDICIRAGLHKIPLILNAYVNIEHRGRRESRRNLFLLWHHVRSAILFLFLWYGY